MLVQACTYLDKSWKSDTPKLCVFIRAHRDSCLGSSNSSIDEQPFPGAWLCEHRCVPRPSSAVFVFLEPIRPEVYVCADVYDITQSLESLDVEHAIGFTHTGQIIRVTPTPIADQNDQFVMRVDSGCQAELTDESDPTRLRELLATALVPADLAALADDPLSYAGFWRELDDWDGRRGPFVPRSIHARSHPRPSYVPPQRV